MWLDNAKSTKDADKKDAKPYESGTPKKVLATPEYRDAVEQFLPQFYKDRALDLARDQDASIDHSEVLEEKERDGYYPNELDEEM